VEFSTLLIVNVLQNHNYPKYKYKITKHLKGWDKFKKKKLSEKHKGKTLCKSGFHIWEVIKENQFDVKQGKLVTVYKCKRCGKQKSTAI